MRVAGYMTLCAVLVLTAAGARNPTGEAKALLGATRTQICARGEIKRTLREARIACANQAGEAAS